MNAVYHRSYEVLEPIEVLPDCITINSFPGPDRSISTKDIKALKFVSRRYRNRRVGEFLKELDLTEGRGTGIPKMIRALKRNGSPMPVFHTDKDRTYLTIEFSIHPAFLEKEAVDDSVVKTGGKTRVETRVKTRVKTGEKILQIIKENPAVTIPELSKMTELTIKGVEWNIKDLKKKELLKRIGPDKGGQWEVIKSKDSNE